MNEKKHEGKHEEKHEGDEGVPVSRVVIEFAGLGSADVKRAEFENITLGQMLMLERYMRWQADSAVARFEEAQAKQAERGKIAVAKLARARMQ